MSDPTSATAISTNDGTSAGSGGAPASLESSASAGGDIEAVSSTGASTVESSDNGTLASSLDTLILTGSGNLVAQANNDPTYFLEGNSGNDTLISGSGSDTLVAGTGIDTLVTGTGDDVFEGQAGDTYLLTPGFGSTRIDLPESSSGTIEFIRGTLSDLSVSTVVDAEGNFALQITDGASVLTLDDDQSGGASEFDLPVSAPLDFQFSDGTQMSFAQFMAAAHVTDSVLSGTNGRVVLDGDADASVTGGSGNDTLVATGTGDTLTAGVFGSQVLYGFGSNDQLVGGLGDDTLYGGQDATFTASGGDTVIYGGSGFDTYVLTAGGTVTINLVNGAPGFQTIMLPFQWSVADFTAVEGTNGDLILKSLSDNTTAIIKGFYLQPDPAAWFVKDSNGDSQELLSMVTPSSGGGSGPDTSYQAQIGELLTEYQANTLVTLNQIGTHGGLIEDPDRSTRTTPNSSFTFNGVTVDNLAVTGGNLSVEASESDQSQTATGIMYGEKPVYGPLTVPASSQLFSIDDPVIQQLQALGDYFGSTELINGVTEYLYDMPAQTVIGIYGSGETLTNVPNGTDYTKETLGFTDYNITGDGGSDTISAAAPFVGTVVTGDGNNVKVDLGGDSSFWQNGGPDSGQPLGAFIEVGNGLDDSILGSGGADIIAAGQGVDTIEAAGGSTVYVPMAGVSTDTINIVNAPYSGSGPFPNNTLVLPEGITQQDLQYQLFTGTSGQVDTEGYTGPGETLQLTYGNSTVLVDFDSGPPGASSSGAASDDTDGINYIQFADGTVLTRAQVLAMAGPAIDPGDNYNPVITQTSSSVAPGGVPVSDLFSDSDASGSAIRIYQFTNDAPEGAYFTLNGQTYGAGSEFDVAADQLSQLEYVAGSPGSAAEFQVSAFDGLNWGQTQSIDLTVAAPGNDNQLFQATGPNQTVAGASSGPDTLIGGYSGDVLVGASGSDTFEYTAGSGAETISETAPVSSTSDNIIQFGSGITLASIALSVNADGALVLSLGSNGDSITIDGFNLTDPIGSSPIQQFEFSDGTSLTLKQLLMQVQGPETSGTIISADGTVTIYGITPGSNFQYWAQAANPPGRISQVFSIGSDGSTESITNTFNSDGSAVETIVFTDTSGAATTSVTDYNAQHQRTHSLEEDPDGGSVAITYDSQGRSLTQDVTRSDGSTQDTTYTYNSDGSSVQTEVDTPADGSGSTTFVTDNNAQGQTTSTLEEDPDGGSVAITYDSQGRSLTQNVTRPDGSAQDTTYTYDSDGDTTTSVCNYDSSGNLITKEITYPGGYTELDTFDAQGREVTVDSTGPDGSTSNSTYSFNADGSYVQTEVTTPAGGGTATTVVWDYDNSGNLTAKTITYPGGYIELDTFDAQGREVTADTTAPDGSTSNSTYSFNADGSYVQTEVNTPAGGEATTTVWNYDSGGNLTAKAIKNPDGSTELDTLDAQGREVTVDYTGPDGSTSNLTYRYNADGSYVQTEVDTPAGGGASTTAVWNYDSSGNVVTKSVTYPGGSTELDTFDAQGRVVSDDTTGPDGSTSNSTYRYNADGSYVQTEVDTPAGGEATTIVWNYDSSGSGIATSKAITNPDGSTETETYDAQARVVSDDITGPDGSTSNSTYRYNADGSYVQTEVDTPAGGQATTIVWNYDSSGDGIATSKAITNPDGSTETETYDAQARVVSDDITGADGSTSNSTYGYNADGSYVLTEVNTPAGGEVTTTVWNYDSSGNLVSDNQYTPTAGGSYTDSWNNSNGSEGGYWWNASTPEYQATWYDASDGVQSTDDYQYSAGGSPGTSGASFVETYSDSAGDSGTRQYNASTGITSVSWYSAATGTITGTVTDSGFIGLQNDGELTNTQNDPSFFNPTTSPAFQHFLAGH